MDDIVEQLRKHHRDVGLSDDVESWLTVAADEIERLRATLNQTRRFALSGEMDTVVSDEIERLREAIRQADYVFELLAPENHGQTSNAEMASLLSSVSGKLSRMVEKWDWAALGEKE